ncbi:MAG: fructose-bisphosphatase class I [Chloroflexi bacterium]|nr:fructose-bisphosphatase class I [Chloroflexota bacterium]|tara:strand:- start:7952 stop:9172 length:1221 start_codon:yes stop_codon:yes gene_type:complete
MSTEKSNLKTFLKDNLNFSSHEGKALAKLILSISDASIEISQNTRRAGLTNILGSANSINVQGEDVQKLDLIANEILLKFLKNDSGCGGYASEELEKPEFFNNEDSSFFVVADPLDGSSNIDVNMPIGTIFGIIRKTVPEKSGFIRSGRYYIASGYILYGPSTLLVIAFNNNVNEFTLDPLENKFYLSDENINVPISGETYSINEGNFDSWSSPIKKWAESRKNSFNELKKSSSLRYVGSLVADAHRTLKKGGIFVYPADKKNPNGKLRLMYEANPYALIFESANGSSSNGEVSILDIEPENFHQRTPLILGSKINVQSFLSVKTTNKKNIIKQKRIFPWNELSISKMRSESKKTILEFSKELNVEQSTVRKWESGIIKPNKKNREKLDDYLLKNFPKLINNPFEN